MEFEISGVGDEIRYILMSEPRLEARIIAGPLVATGFRQVPFLADVPSILNRERLIGEIAVLFDVSNEVPR